MRYNIYGFNQKKLIEYGLDQIDAMLLRYFIDFKGTGKMVTKKINGKNYYWVQYKKIIQEYPILRLKKDSVYRRFKNMTEKSILTHKSVVDKGVYSFYNLGTEFKYLVGYSKGDELEDEWAQPSEINPVSYGNKSGAPTDLNPEQIIPLLKDNSTKDINNIYTLVIKYLNKKANKNYRTTTKKSQQLIRARVNEGFLEQDFYKVIDNKVSQWLGTKMDKYLRPETLFGTKFEGYLNENRGEDRYGEDFGNLEETEQSKFGIKV
ncbi:putative phage protein (TIGR02220 family) [Clostridium tetanomorphum]|uniref:conserved phage C-terminal domain-containing protein n=1 Tax=Clostridium tetanomorphum TaxID=1553 RepID=UPI000447B264|nr:conserved phage C-terminal domain-containing protein [Clostridium tetanomorphum]KAJ50154.1 hypothetical protein CTM_18889 [Clostridium tetanomorphum DSM 665]KAJ50939.1 hypothetical protein CTM_15523 [Clostridium tetanomorphum DSM 665]MBP1864268.1 putative phage protein (TIGR02220 family) [Clostridium tetanomorphum]NRS83715.1 putative phage protein (TIGR02220 family) [Clostridium tetanomorphum]SQC02123.1 phage-related regulatory protein [Clostridium tetanomorphum]